MKKSLQSFGLRLFFRTLSNWRNPLSFFLLIASSFPLLTSAQNKQWDKTIGGAESDYLVTAQQTSDGGYIIGGTSGSRKGGDKTQNRKGGNDFWIVKLNADGSKKWDKTVGGPNRYEELQSLQQTPDGGYILLGNSNWVVKLNPDGTTAWEKIIGINGSPTIFSSLKTLQLTNDGGFIVGGSAPTVTGGDKTDPGQGYLDFWIVKFNADGTKAWDKAVGGNNYDYLTSLQQTNDGGYILGGTTSSGKGGDKSEELLKDGNYQDYWLVKLNADRTKAWDKTIGLKRYDELTSLRQTRDGGFILGGSADISTSEFKSEPSRGSFDYWLIKVMPNGRIEWNKRYGGRESDKLHDLQQTSDGGYILGGSSYSNSSTDKSSDNLGNWDYWVLKINADRTIAWDVTLGGTDQDSFETLFQTKDGGYFLGGTSFSDSSLIKSENRVGQHDYWLVKLGKSAMKKQTITFEPIPDVNYPTQKSLILKATASSGLPVSYKLITGPATIKNNTLNLTGGSGTVTVSASQTGNQTYLPAPNDSIRFVVQVPPITRLWDKSFGGIPKEYFDQYTKFYGTSTLSAMVPTSDGGYMLGGTSDSNVGNDKTQRTRGKSDFWLVKIDAAGKKLWDKVYGGKDSDGLQSLIATPDGGYLLGGNSNSAIGGEKSEDRRGTPISNGYIPSDYWIVKVDKDGNKLWDKTFGGISDDRFTSLVATPDGGYLLGGDSYSNKGGDKSQPTRGNSDYWVVKVDAQGNKVWDKTLGGNTGDYLEDMLVTPDSGYLLGGNSSSKKGNEKSEDSRNPDEFSIEAADYWIIKLDAAGNKLWDKTLGSEKEDQFAAMAAMPDGGYLLAGTSGDIVNGDKTAANKGKLDYWLIKIDANGQKIWDKTYGGDNSDALTALISTPDGGYLLGGNSSSNISGDKSEPSRGGITEYYLTIDYWVIKIDASGTKLWDRTFGTYTNEYGTTADQLTSLVSTSDGNYVVGGSTDVGVSGDKSSARKGVRDIWVVKIREEATTKALSWDMRFGGSADDNFTDAIKTSDGGYLIGGYSKSGTSGDKSQTSQGKNDYWIVKTDKNGKKLWDKRYGGAANDYLNRVIQTQEGGYLLAGSSRSSRGGDKSEDNHGANPIYYNYRDYWVVKIDAQGNKQWDKSYGGSGYDELEKVIQLSTGEYVLGGSSEYGGTGDQSQQSRGGYDYWLVKISSNGTKIWDQRYGGPKDEYLAGFTLTKNGGFLLGGTSFSGKGGDKSQASRGEKDFWLVRTDQDGNKLWDKSFGGSGQDEAASVLQSNGDNFIIAGTSNSSKNIDKTESSHLSKDGGYITNDFWIIKTDGNGNKLWDKTLGSIDWDILSASTYTPNGGYVLAGSSFSDQSGDKTQNSQGGWDYWVVNLDAKGNKKYDKRFGGSEGEELRTVFQTIDGGILLGGRSNSGVSGDKTQPSQGGDDYWLVKLAPETSSLVTAREVSVIEEPFALTNTLTAYPNPFNDQVTVQFTLPETQTTTVKIYDNQGREVSTLFNGEVKVNQTYQVKWQATSYKAGLYFLQLQTPTLRQQQKLLLSK